ncbi:MAG: bifunctional (p)ppGpp synthetase/guanosine-3',5'-bis(diphosphate) 3'-pyrophosphohydrolase [Betaproteobacteria bacterium]|nr:bifunctional (p)ppGpp synthetase/guanosine-3',5'-bis(diphosphate) 3'-pyrophosphohydrolase [Betaproteobacteria bacterium]
MEKTSQLKLVRPPARDLPGAGSALAMLATGLTPAERERVQAAWLLAEPVLRNVRLASGEPALGHALGTAAIVSELKLDGEAVAAALLVPVAEQDPGSLGGIKERCGSAVAELVDGVVRMAHIHALSSRATPGPAGQVTQLEGLRKMLLAMVQDIRVVLVKLADHAQGLRFAVKSDDATAMRGAAALTNDIFGPLANRLGVWQLKWEIEDLAFRIREPETYKKIARLLDGKRLDRERYIDNVIAHLKGELTHSGIAAEVTGRPKHIFSIYKKMRSKDIDFESLYDVRAVRILVRDVKDCYAALGLVHNLWTPIPKEFDDYIAKPKSNQYRSLHTAVIGPQDKALEVQIRTHEMHQNSELGVAAHWRYKEGSRGDQSYDRKIAWLRQILEWKDEEGGAGELAEQFRTGLFEDTLYALTPQGRVIALPKGATPVDFAYHVHTELGHRCRGARVDGAMVSLNTPLANGQRIEILAARQGGPSRDWLNPELGYVRSHAARAKIRQWFNRQNVETAIAQGRAAVEKELRRQGMTALGLDKPAAQLGFAKTDEFLAGVGRGEIRIRQLEQGVRALGPRADARGAESRDEAPAAPTRKARTASGKSSVLVVGVDRLLTVPAKCCKPAPPDAIVGFVTRGRGVTIHRAGCASLKRLDAKRRMAADWGEAAGAAFPVDVEVVAAARAGLSREISDVLAREKIRILGARPVEHDATARLRYTLEVSDLGQLARVLALIRKVRGVSRAVRR